MTWVHILCVLAGTTFGMGVDDPPSQEKVGEASGSSRIPGLSFDIHQEFEVERQKLVPGGVVTKSNWGSIEGLKLELVGKRATREDRRLLVEHMIAGGRVDPEDELLGEIRPHLIKALAADGAVEVLVRHLSQNCPGGGISGPLVGLLHDLRQEGVLEAGVAVLCDAHDLASPEGAERIRDVLDYDFRYTREQLKAEGDIVAWCREWYAANKDRVISNYQTYISGGEDGWTAHVLMPVEEWFRREMRRVDMAHSDQMLTSTFGLDPFATETLGVTDTAMIAEQRYWAARFNERPPTEWSIAIVDAAAGRENRFALQGVVCDLTINWAGAVAEDGVSRCKPRTATLPMRFAFDWACCPKFVGEDWRLLPADEAPEDERRVIIKYIHPHRSVAERVAVQATGIAATLWGDGLEGARVVKVYPDGPSLQLFVAPNAPIDLVAHAVPGGSLKIVAGGGTTDAVIMERLRAAARCRDDLMRVGPPRPTDLP